MPTLITEKRLKELFIYDPSTGLFTWRVSRGKARAGSVSKCKDSSTGYIRIWADGKLYHAHRLAFLYMTGVIPDEVDHINHIQDDNRWANLRPASHKENIRNCSLSKNNKSGCNGVSYDTQRKKWAAYIHVDAKKISLGRFDTKKEAILARHTADVKHSFHENHGTSGF